MDLHPIAAHPTAAERAAVDTVLGAAAPRGPTVANVSTATACRPAGAGTAAAELTRALGPGGTGTATPWLRSPCIGMCERAPAAFLPFAGEFPGAETMAPTTAAE